MTTARSSSRPKPRSRAHSTNSPSKSPTKAALSRKRSRSGSGGRKESAAFYCMRCKVHSPSAVERYVTEKWGNRQATMAKGFCKKCDGKMSLIVPASSKHSASGHTSRSHSGRSTKTVASKSRPKSRSKSPSQRSHSR